MTTNPLRVAGMVSPLSLHLNLTQLSKMEYGNIIKRKNITMEQLKAEFCNFHSKTVDISINVVANSFHVVMGCNEFDHGFIKYLRDEVA